MKREMKKSLARKSAIFAAVATGMTLAPVVGNIADKNLGKNRDKIQKRLEQEVEDATKARGYRIYSEDSQSTGTMALPERKPIVPHIKPTPIKERVETPSKLDTITGRINPWRYKEAREIVEGKYDELIQDKNLITPELIMNVIYKESRGNANAYSHAGAGGIMQLMPGTWTEVGEGSFYENVFDREKNIQAGMKYLQNLSDILEKQHPEWEDLSKREQIRLLLASYNAGPNAVKRSGYKISQLAKETQLYATN